MGLVFENKNNSGSLRLIDVNNNGGFSVIFSSLTPTPSITPTINVSPIVTPSISLTPTPSISITPTISITPSITNTPSVSRTPSVTPSISITPSVTPSAGVNTLVTDNLILHLDASSTSSYSGTGTTWFDLVGNYDAAISGAITDGGLFYFDGINDTISIPHSSSLSLNTSTQKTIQVWVKFDALGGLNQQIPVFGKLSSGFGFDGYWGGLFSNGGTVRAVTNGTSVQRISTSTSTVATDTWYLFTFISQITSTSNTTKVYINTTEYITTAHGTDTYSESNPLYLGFIGTGVSSLYLNGKIGACYFYTKGLSVSEVSTNYNATKTRYGL